MSWKSLKERSKAQLKGRWGKATLAFFVIGLVPVALWFINLIGTSSVTNLYAVIGCLLLYCILVYAILGVIWVGIANYCLGFVAMGRAGIGNVFIGFKRFWGSVKAGLWYMLVLLLWVMLIYGGWALMFLSVGIFEATTLMLFSIGNLGANPSMLFLIFPFTFAIISIVYGGIYVLYNRMYAYSAMFYIKAANPTMTARKCMTLSKTIMKDKRWNLFGLHLSFILWIMLSICTFGIALIWVIPYIKITEANYMYPILKENGLVGVSEEVISEETPKEIVYYEN